MCADIEPLRNELDALCERYLSLISNLKRWGEESELHTRYCC